MLWMRLFFGRILSLCKCLSIPLGSKDLQAPASPHDSTKVHVPSGGFQQGRANLPTSIARVSGASLLQEATWNLNNHQQPCLKSSVIYAQGGKPQNEGFFGWKGDVSWWMKGILSLRGSWFPCSQMATGSRPDFASWPCSSVMITTDWIRSLVTMRILNTPEWFLKIFRFVQYRAQHLTPSLEKWEGETNDFKIKAVLRSAL